MRREGQDNFSFLRRRTLRFGETKRNGGRDPRVKSCNWFRFGNHANHFFSVPVLRANGGRHSLATARSERTKREQRFFSARRKIIPSVVEHRLFNIVEEESRHGETYLLWALGYVLTKRLIGIK